VAKPAQVIPPKTKPPIPASDNTQVEPARILIMHALGAGLAGVKTLLLITGTELAIGRQPTKPGAPKTAPDFPLPATPPSFKMLSRRHVILNTKAGKVTLRDGGAEGHETNGSRLGTEPLAINPLVWDLKGEPELKMADVLSLKLKHQESVAPCGPALNARYESGDSTRTQPRPSGAVRFGTVHPALSDMRVAWVFTDCTIGRDAGCGIQLNVAALEPGHLFIHYLLGSFWIEAGKGVSDLKLDGVSIPTNEAVPVKDGQRLEFAKETWQLDLAP
jgi:hypothetical protein